MNKVLVTTSWDDGHILDLKLSELLKKYNLKGTFYVSPNNREFSKSELLNKDELLKISNDFEVGAHTMTHPHLTKVSMDDARKEIVESKIYLENNLNTEVKSFCFPAGYYRKEHKDILQEIGFVFSRTVERFSIKNAFDSYFAPTTVHAYRHLSDIFKVIKTVGFKKFIKAYLNWDELAILMFDKTINEGGVYHIWGHSWEIDKNNDWDRLERVFKYISNKKDVNYVTNSELAYE